VNSSLRYHLKKCGQVPSTQTIAVVVGASNSSTSGTSSSLNAGPSFKYMVSTGGTPGSQTEGTTYITLQQDMQQALQGRHPNQGELVFMVKGGSELQNIIAIPETEVDVGNTSSSGAGYQVQSQSLLPTSSMQTLTVNTSGGEIVGPGQTFVTTNMAFEQQYEHLDPQQESQINVTQNAIVSVGGDGLDAGQGDMVVMDTGTMSLDGAFADQGQVQGHHQSSGEVLGELDAQGAQEVEVYACSECSATFSTFPEAEAHVMTSHAALSVISA